MGFAIIKAMLSHETIKNLPNNSRFYILLFSFLLSAFTACLLRMQVAGDQLFYIRTEQVFGFIAIGYVYMALIISPLQKIVGKPDWMKNVLFARRAIGVSAAYFAFLHATVALWGQIGGLDGVGLLPQTFRWSLAFGAIALLVLFLMAATSFDKVITFMTFKHWKWLHRFVYSAGVLIILHVWMIGTHVVYGSVQIICATALGLLFGLQSWRIVSNFAKRFPVFKSLDYFITLFICLWLFWTLLLFAMPSYVQSYHGQHHHDVQIEGGHHHE